MARRNPRVRGDCDQLSRSAVAACRREGDPAGDPAQQYAIRRPHVNLPARVRCDVRRRRRARRPPGYAARLPRDHDFLVAGLRESRARRRLRHAGRQPIPARHGRGRRVPGRHEGDCRMVPGSRAVDRHGSRQCRHRGRRRRRAAGDCRDPARRQLALGIRGLRRGGARLGGVVVENLCGAGSSDVQVRRCRPPARHGQRSSRTARCGVS